MTTSLSLIEDQLEGIQPLLCCLTLLESERLKLLGWLSKVPYRRHHTVAGKGYLRNTCEWLFQKAEYYDWMNDSSSSILWLHGIRMYYSI